MLSVDKALKNKETKEIKFLIGKKKMSLIMKMLNTPFHQMIYDNRIYNDR